MYKRDGRRACTALEADRHMVAKRVECQLIGYCAYIYRLVVPEYSQVVDFKVLYLKS